MMMVGNKCDLANDREVTAEEGRQLARDSNALFLETSAKERINIEESFFELVREIRRQSGPSNPSGGGGGGGGRGRPECCVIV